MDTSSRSLDLCPTRRPSCNLANAFHDYPEEYIKAKAHFIDNG
jgi:hypothetical protein